MTPDHGPDQGTTAFDALLRAKRLAAGLTQAELAGRAGVGIRTVRDLERGRSRPQRTTMELLAKALGLTGRERADFLDAARGTSVEPGAAPAGGPAGVELPPAGDLIGRDHDIAELAALLDGLDSRTVSLVGLAGVGKTGLALAVAHRAAAAHPAGVAGIVVSDVSTPDDVLAAIASVFGVGRAADLAGRLSGAPALLMVDAVERAPDAVAVALTWLAGAAPTLRVLATGRHPIGLPGERVWPVTPLEVPPADVQADLDAAAGYPAAALFLARLRQVRREPLEPDEVGALIGLVRRLGGLPLALELAAARGRVLDLNEILNRYGDRVLDLAGPAPAEPRGDAARTAPATREAVTVTLRDAVAASYRLLEADERRALRRLSAFRNRWSVDLAESMLADETGQAAGGDPVELLDRLIALGLLSVRGSGPFRFRLLDVVRDFATERAAANGELGRIRRRHAVVFAALAARTAPELAGGNFSAAVGRLDDVASDLWAALAYSANDDPHTAIRLAAGLPRWWRFRGRDVPGRQWLRRLLDDPRTADADPIVRAWAGVGVGQLAAEHGGGAEELPAAEAALTEFQRAGDLTGELAARSLLCALWMTTGGYDEARRHGEAVLALASRAGRIRDMAVAQNNLTWHEIRAGDLRAARRRLAQVDRLAAECGEHRLRALARANLAEVARLDGRYAEAEAVGRRAIAALAELGDPGHRRRVLGTIGRAHAQAGQVDEARVVLAEIRQLMAASEPATPERLALGRVESGEAASIEAILAFQRGDKESAAEWFNAAAQAYAGGHDLRDVAEALVWLVASTEEPEARRSVVDWLTSVCKEGGITLLPRERALIGG
ncbi:helix-turn-helix domain-containing protein [Phytohabitans sp. ZYX-F-186]|uniref:Helix-turn-helix domain-containing protein n=1 Tax=Phytohabitans maris TaxID=3071409 RepID=A0ABU0ZKE0_9ACTN|nr:helix-turn-helix domain-containing protein [Phytohabitans sp. ZYX-F-186]MDQ7906996.1 helix-turn-helix domain-containing protein [Phytohabitans sp. ZYX-F-186]